MLETHSDSHLDHHLTRAQIDCVLAAFADRDAFFIATIELPDGLGTVPCGLHGPRMGDPPITDAEVSFVRRGTRSWDSRVVDRPTRQTRTVTIIAGPHDGKPCVVYTMFGGPVAPREPGDPEARIDESRAFWSEHALSREG